MAPLLAPVIRNVMQKRLQSAIGGPPHNRVSTAEKIVLGGGMCVAILVYPAYVLYNLRSYKGQ